MSEYLRGALSGWAAAMIFASGLAMPYLMRRIAGGRTPFLRRMWPHYWLGYLAFVVSFIHSWITMSSGNLKGMSMPGLWLATVALLVMLWQIAVGLLLRNPTQSNRRALRRTHFWTMASVTGLILAHIVLNRG